MSNEIFKQVKSIDGLVINHDGTLIYHNERLLNVVITQSQDRGKRKILNLRGKTYVVARLVYEAWVSPIPKYRKVSYIDGDNLNCHYKNLLPRTRAESLCLNFKPVDGLENVVINSNGTEIYQDDINVNITFLKGATKKASAICVLHTWRGARYFYVAHLVANAWLNWSGRGFILHRDNDILNNHYKNLKPVTLKEYRQILSKNVKALPALRKYPAIPKKHHENVKIRLLAGEAMASIGFDFCCSEMAVHRLKVKLLTKQEIEELHKRNGIVTEKTPKHIVDAVILELKKNKKKQIEIAKKYGLTPTVVCRIARINGIKCNPQKKIDDRLKRKIKNDYKKYTAKYIAEKYNINESSVYRIKNETT